MKDAVHFDHFIKSKSGKCLKIHHHGHPERTRLDGVKVNVFRRRRLAFELRAVVVINGRVFAVGQVKPFQFQLDLGVDFVAYSAK